MTLLPDWKHILKNAWSVWAAYVLIALSAVEILFALVGEPIFGPVMSAAIKAVIASLLMLFRIIAQKQFQDAVGVGEEQ